jgi:ACR3 family arsenite efflux pump ArsB
LVLLFGFQGEQIVRQPLIIALLAVPIIIQVISMPASPTRSIARWAFRTTPPTRRP